MTHDAATAPIGRFRLDPTGRAGAFALAQEVLHRADPSLQPHVHALQHHVTFDDDARPRRRPLVASALGPVAVPRRPLNRLDRRRWQGDVLVCPTWLWERPQEIRLLCDLVAGLLAEDVHVLLPVHRGSPVREHLARVGEEARAGRLSVFDPRDPARVLDTQLAGPEAAATAATAMAQIRELLAPHGLAVAEDARSGVAWSAARMADWAAATDRVRVDAVVVRCHWLPLCSAVAADALDRGLPVTTLQQGVISHTIDAPVTATRYLAFGPRSAAFATQLDADLARRTGRPSHLREAVGVGSLIDPVVALPDPHATGTALVLDQSSARGSAYYDLDDRTEALHQQVEALAATGARVAVRLHPDGLAGPRWQQLAARHPGQVEVRAADRPLVEDLRDAAVAVGLFSGALAAAAACGVPPVFLAADLTPDLDPFLGHQVDAGSLATHVRRLLDDADAHADARQRGLDAARGYLQDGRAATPADLAAAVLAP